MKNIALLAIVIFAISCGNHSTADSQNATHSNVSDTGSLDSRPNPGLNASTDTTPVNVQKGTNGIPSRTGTTGQGNTTVTGAATGSPTGIKDSTKK